MNLLNPYRFRPTNYVFDGGASSYMIDKASTPTLLDGIVDQAHVIRVKRISLLHQHGILGLDDIILGLKFEVDASDNKADVLLSDEPSGNTVSFTNKVVSNDLGWHTYVISYDSTELKLYEDGISVGTATSSAFVSRVDGHILALGAAVIGGTGVGKLKGEISDYQFYNRGFTSTEAGNISANLKDFPTDHATSLVANFAGKKSSNGIYGGDWHSEKGGYVLKNKGTVTFN